MIACAKAARFSCGLRSISGAARVPTRIWSGRVSLAVKAGFPRALCPLSDERYTTRDRVAEIRPMRVLGATGLGHQADDRGRGGRCVESSRFSRLDSSGTRACGES